MCVGCGNNKSLLHKELCLTSLVGITLVSVILAIYTVSLTTNHLEEIWHSFFASVNSLITQGLVK